MPERHEFALLRLRQRHNGLWGFLQHQRMVPHHLHRWGYLVKDWVFRAADVGDFAVHGPDGFHHPSPEELPQRLVPQANAQHGQPRMVVLNDRWHHTRLLWRTRPRRQHNALQRKLLQFFQRHIIAPHLHLCAQLPEVVIEVVGKRIKVV